MRHRLASVAIAAFGGLFAGLIVGTGVLGFLAFVSRAQN